MSVIVVSFVGFLLIFLGVGTISALVAKPTTADYLLAGRAVKPWLAALSAVATNNSGYMFVGMIGYTYLQGLSSIWLMVGWLMGDFLAARSIQQPLREMNKKREALSFVETIARWHGRNDKALRFIGSVVTVIFLSIYAAAQLKAGSKALHVLFGWDSAAGIVIGGVMVVAYCMAGGIRASIWTDAAQSLVMIAAMTLLCIAAVDAMGGLDAFYAGMQEIDAHYASPWPSNQAWPGLPGAVLFILGWFGGGYGVIGQPQVMMRFMAVDDPNAFWRVRAYYYSWFAAFYAVTIGAGLGARLLLPATAGFDAELALPSLALQLLPGVAVGLIVAGLFAATMSTADSLVISCTASITRDIFPALQRRYLVAKLVTLTVTAFSVGIALYAGSSVFWLVLIAWGLLASAFAPLLTVNALGGTPSHATSLAMMLGGIATMLAWRFAGLSSLTYEILPGLLAGFAIYGIAWLAGRLRSAPVRATSL